MVVCVNCDDFTNGLDQQIIRDGSGGVRDVQNRGKTHSQLDSHKECYRVHETWSLDLLAVCRKIYHEGKVLPPKRDLLEFKLSFFQRSGTGAIQEEHLRSS